MIPVYYWENKKNLGEAIIPIIIKWISGEETLWVPRQRKQKFLVIGSEMPTNQLLQEGDIVWGYGNRYNKKVFPPKGVTFLAVRGKITRESIQAEVPEIYGDPGCLMPLIYSPKIEKKYEFGIISHHTERYLFDNIKDKNILKIDIMGDPYVTINEILKCNTIFSSSLHGCIISEAYGIPTVWFLGQKESEGFEIKFSDYFSGTNRDKKINPIIFQKYNLSEIIKNKNNILSKPTFFQEELIHAWKEYWEIKGGNFDKSSSFR